MTEQEKTKQTEVRILLSRMTDSILCMTLNEKNRTIDNYAKSIVKLFDIPNVVVPKGTLKTKPKRKLKDYDVWYEPCERCGYDTGKCPKTMDNKRCWQCGNRVKRDFTDRALKK